MSRTVEMNKCREAQRSLESWYGSPAAFVSLHMPRGGARTSPFAARFIPVMDDGAGREPEIHPSESPGSMKRRPAMSSSGGPRNNTAGKVDTRAGTYLSEAGAVHRWRCPRRIFGRLK